MDRLAFITALAAASAERGDACARSLLDGIELVIDRLAQEGHPSSAWMDEVRDFIALAKEHSV